MTRSDTPVAVEATDAHDTNRVPTGRRPLTSSRAQPTPCLYTLVPTPHADPSIAKQLPVTVRCERELRVGSQVWVEQECWELLERHAPPDDAPERRAFLCATSPPPRARILAGDHESWLYEPDLLDLARAVRHVHADETPATRTIQAAIRAALDGAADVEANLAGSALRVLAQAIRGLEISHGLSSALHELARNLNQHFDDLKELSNDPRHQ